MKNLLGVQLRYLLKCTELTEVVRNNDKPFIDLLNKDRVGKIDDDVENLLKVKLIRGSDENHPKMPWTYIQRMNQL